MAPRDRRWPFPCPAPRWFGVPFEGGTPFISKSLSFCGLVAKRKFGLCGFLDGSGAAFVSWAGKPTISPSVKTLGGPTHRTSHSRRSKGLLGVIRLRANLTNAEKLRATFSFGPFAPVPLPSGSTSLAALCPSARAAQALPLSLVPLDDPSPSSLISLFPSCFWDIISRGWWLHSSWELMT
jgi:hypothetical protein